MFNLVKLFLWTKSKKSADNRSNVEGAPIWNFERMRYFNVSKFFNFVISWTSRTLGLNRILSTWQSAYELLKGKSRQKWPMFFICQFELPYF